MNRRLFLGAVVAAAPALIVDPAQLLWRPGQRSYFDMGGVARLDQGFALGYRLFVGTVESTEVDLHRRAVRIRMRSNDPTARPFVCALDVGGRTADQLAGVALQSPIEIRWLKGAPIVATEQGHGPIERIDRYIQPITAQRVLHDSTLPHRWATTPPPTIPRLRGGSPW